MALMTNAEAFRYDFGIYATELWAMTEAQFLEWLNADCDREKPNAVHIVRCKDCVYSSVIPKEMQNVGEWCCEFWYAEMHEDDYCSCGKRRKDER